MHLPDDFRQGGADSLAMGSCSEYEDSTAKRSTRRCCAVLTPLLAIRIMTAKFVEYLVLGNRLTAAMNMTAMRTTMVAVWANAFARRSCAVTPTLGLWVLALF